MSDNKGRFGPPMGHRRIQVRDERLNAGLLSRLAGGGDRGDEQAVRFGRRGVEEVVQDVTR